MSAAARNGASGGWWAGFLRRTGAMTVKEFIQLRRDRVSFAMIIMLPLMQLILFGYAINTTPRNLPTAVLLQEQSDVGRSILKALENTAYFDVTHVIQSEAAFDQLLASGRVLFAIEIPANFERALRRISVERGHDVRESALVAFGGAGPLHACDLADALGMREVIVPPGAGVLSAWGLLGADERHDAARTLLWRIAPGVAWPASRARATFASLRAELEQRHGRGGDARFEAVWRMRYRGQSFELEVRNADGDLAREFHRVHRERYGYAQDESEIEIVSARLRSFGLVEKLALTKIAGGKVKPFRRVKAHLDGRKVECALYNRDELPAGAKLKTPCIVAEYSATTLIPGAANARVDGFGNLIIGNLV